MKLTITGCPSADTWPSALNGTSGSSGSAHITLTGFLSLLETHLGLLAAAPDPALRLLRYVARLRGCGADRFWSASLAVDDLGTAAAVMSLRNELIGGGWNGRASAGAPRRIADLSVAESTPGPLTSGDADRARAVLATLTNRRVPISELQIAGGAEALPPAWQAIVDALRVQGVKVGPADGPAPASRGDLADLKRILAGGGVSVAKGDGSLVVLHAGSDAEAAEAVAALFARRPPGAILVAGEDDALDAALRARGVASCGTAPASRLRPALQALRLALAVRWDPPDPRRVLELLVLPGGPVARAAAGKLARVLREEPGFGAAWKEKLRESGAEEWFGADRFAQAMPAEAAAKTAKRVAAWAGRDSETDPIKAAAAGAASRFAELVEAHGGQLARVGLERLLDIAAGEGVDAPDRFAQAGHVPRVAHPGAIVGEAGSVVWWSFSADDAPTPPRSPWSRTEREWLATNGVVLDDPAARARREAEAMLSPVRYAKDALVLVVPDRRGGVEAAPHPVLDRVRAAFGPSFAKLEVEASDVLAGRAPVLGLKLGGDAVTPKSLPRLRRWWSLAPGTIPARATESYSSLEVFAQSPFKWVLCYSAGIEAGELGGLPEGSLLLGRLAEALILDVAADEAFLAKATEGEVAARVGTKLPGLLVERGAILLQPGFELERERLRACSTRAAWTLVQSMRAGKWRYELDLKVLKGEFCGGPITGVADMVLGRAAPPKGILDLKWGWRSGRFRQLKENRALQLAIYAHCLREKNGPFPHIGYLIIEEAEILATSAGVFPGATEVVCAGDCADLLKAFEVRWGWRRKQLDAGRIEVVVEGTTPDAESQPPAGALEMEDETPFNDHVHLLGWKDGA